MLLTKLHKSIVGDFEYLVLMESSSFSSSFNLLYTHCSRMYINYMKRNSRTMSNTMQLKNSGVGVKLLKMAKNMMCVSLPNAASCSVIECCIIATDHNRTF